MRLRFEGNLSDEWQALATAANNLPSPGGPALRIASSMSASQARQTPPVPVPLLLSGAGHNAGDGKPARRCAAFWQALSVCTCQAATVAS